ncbi:uncharacterized protein [Eurosta solidaginis]|uniref:uncharacterized protein n=1 Tax=Eurosta solidaginis TaxID=178769 RepID=UPI0035305684
MNKGDHIALRSLIDNVASIKGALLSIGSEKDIMEALLIDIILTRLDADSKKAYDERQEFKELPSFEKCYTNLSHRCQLLESWNKRSPDVANHIPNSKVSKSKAFVTSKSKCVCCQAGDHLIHRCMKFRNMSVAQRFDLAKLSSLCINCLGTGHVVAKCPSQTRCRVCNTLHHTLLHRVPSSGETPLSSSSTFSFSHSGSAPAWKSGSNQPTNQNFTSQTPTTLLARATGCSIIPTAIVLIKDACGIFQPVRALLDSCSELNFITLETAKRLRLHQIRFNQEVAGIAGASERVSTKVETTIQSRFSNFNCTAEFAVVNTISSRQPSQYIDTKSLEFPPNVNLADPYFFKPHKIDLLIGTDIFFELLDEGKLSLDGNQCLIVNTLLGWIVGGKYENHSTLRSNACYFTKSLSSPDLSAQLQRFWEIEEYKQEQQLSEEHVACEAHYVKNVTYTADNRVQVSLPFIGSPKALGNSFQNAYRRFISLERRFKRDSELGKSYTEFMKEYAALGHMSPISEVDISPNHYFIPHHAVLRPTNVTTKLRVVFDASQKTSSNVSLNDLLMVGPTIQPDLITTLLKFRLYKHALTADICKMYRQFGMSPKDRQFQLIVWRDEPHLPLQFYELNTITYGTASAPFLAIRSLFFIAETYGNLYPLGAHVLKSDLYVDDVLTGADTLEELKQRKFELTQLLAMAKLELAKWNSNCIELFTNSDEVAIQLASGVTSTLGMLWKPRSDQFCFQFNDEPHRNTTKRLILSKTAKIYDLLGLLSPIVIRCKMLLQALWLHGASWDEEVPKPLSDLWASIEDDLPNINTISVPRYAFTSPSQRGELHGFSDASERAYGCCIYTRIWHNVKAQSVPRLELCAALLLIRTWKKFEVNLKQNINTVYFWMDSTTVLQWLKTHSSTLTSFVANRVSEIQEHSQGIIWRHVPSKDNPADLISRGCSAADLCSTIWFSGPLFLSKESKHWPELVVVTDAPVEEQRKPKRTQCYKTNHITHIVNDIVNRNSSYIRILRIIAFIHRVYNTVPPQRKMQIQDVEPISAAELNNAFNFVAVTLQRDFYSSEINALENNKNIPPSFQKLSPLLCQLQIFKKMHTVVRVGGRLLQAPIPIEARCPLILPHDHRFIILYIEHLHRTNLHACNKKSWDSYQRTDFIQSGHFIFAEWIFVDLSLPVTVSGVKFPTKPMWRSLCAFRRKQYIWN